MSRKQELLYAFLTAVLSANVVNAANSVPSNVADVVALDDGYHVRNTDRSPSRRSSSPLPRARSCLTAGATSSTIR